MLSQQRKLFGWWRGLQPDGSAITHLVELAEPRHLSHRRRGEGGRQVRAVSVHALVPRHELRPVALEHGHEVLSGAWAQVQHAGPDAGGPCFACRFDHRLDLLRPVGQTGQDRRHADARLDACGDELLDRSQALLRWRCAGLGLPPDVHVYRRDAEGHAQVGALGELGQDVDVADDHRAARDEARRVAEITQRLEALPRELEAALCRLIWIGRRTDDDGLFLPGPPRQLAAQHLRHVGLDADGPAVAVVVRAIGAQLVSADVAERAPVLAADIRVERPVEAHALHGVQGGLALDLVVVDVGPPRLELGHRDSLEQMFALLTGWVAPGFFEWSNAGRLAGGGGTGSEEGGPRKGLISGRGGALGACRTTGRSRSGRIPRSEAAVR